MQVQDAVLYKEVTRMRNNTKVLLWVLGGALLILLLFAGLMGSMGGMGSTMGGGMMGGMGAMMGGGMMGGGMIGMLFMLLFWGLVIALLVTLIVWVINQGQRR